jgi:hypothetical protein
MNDPAAHRYQERELLINNEEFSTGISTTANYCERMKAHIDKMKSLGGHHINDLAKYISDMKKQNCPSSGGRRASKKHSKKHRKSKKSRKSKKTKSRRH